MSQTAMSQFVLSVGDIVEFDFKITVTGPKGDELHSFKMLGDRLDSARFEEETKQKIKTDDWLCQRLKGWSGQKLVLGTDGNPVEFSVDALKFMLRIPNLSNLLFADYVRAFSAKDGAEKNSHGR